MIVLVIVVSKTVYSHLRQKKSHNTDVQAENGRLAVIHQEDLCLGWVVPPGGVQSQVSLCACIKIQRTCGQPQRQVRTVSYTNDQHVFQLSGVPQGSVLGTCLFLFYINDIADNSTSTVRLFADDAIIVHKLKTNTAALQEDLHKLDKWAKKWNMKLNLEMLHGQILETVSQAKYLGITSGGMRT